MNKKTKSQQTVLAAGGNHFDTIVLLFALLNATENHYLKISASNPKIYSIPCTKSPEIVTISGLYNMRPGNALPMAEHYRL